MISTHFDLDVYVSNERNKRIIDICYDDIYTSYEENERNINERLMQRREFTFHSGIKLLGFLSFLTFSAPGDIIEIGVWKGFSLALMRKLCHGDARLLGVDPCEIPGQFEELKYFRGKIFPECTLIRDYSASAYRKVRAITSGCKLLHIDGDHRYNAVILDFLIYEKMVLPGGWVVFDDYSDPTHSPDVRSAVDFMRNSGLFCDYFIHGNGVSGFPNSYVLEKIASE